MSLGPAQKAEIIDRIYTEEGLPSACKKCDQPLRLVMDAMDEDSDFADGVNQALSRLTALGEQELFRRAVHGTESYVTSQGRLVRIPDPDLPGNTVPLIERKYSDALLTTFMKSRARETYGDKVEVHHRHSGHIAVPVISAADLMRALESGQLLDFQPTDAEFKVLSDQSEPDFSMAEDEDIGFGI